MSVTHGNINDKHNEKKPDLTQKYIFSLDTAYTLDMSQRYIYNAEKRPIYHEVSCVCIKAMVVKVDYLGRAQVRQQGVHFSSLL